MKHKGIKKKSYGKFEKPDNLKLNNAWKEVSGNGCFTYIVLH